MSILNRSSYVKGISEMARWNATTVVRFPWKIKDYTADKRVERLSKHRFINSIFYTIEDDSEGGINHLHLLIDGKVDRKKLAEGLNTNIKSILNVESIRSKFHLVDYITKRIGYSGHHNFFM